jgi:hypothetical protein
MAEQKKGKTFSTFAACLLYKARIYKHKYWIAAMLSVPDAD